MSVRTYEYVQYVLYVSPNGYANGLPGFVGDIYYTDDTGAWSAFRPALSSLLPP